MEITLRQFIELVDAACADAPKWAIEKAAILRRFLKREKGERPEAPPFGE